MIEQNLVSLAILFFFVIIGGIVSARFKQPIEIGLLLVGAIIGPKMLNLVHNQSIIDLFIEFGAILLLFVIGLEFVLPKLLKIGAKALMFGILKVGIIFFITYEVFLFLDMNILTGIIFGFILSLSSTVVIVKILESKGLYRRNEMPLLIGILLIEDIIGVIIIAFLEKAAQDGGLVSVIWKILIALIALTIAYLVMIRIAKHIISWSIQISGEEIVPFIALGMCVGFGYLAYVLGLSPAIGAFLAGSIIASCPQVNLFEHSVKPYTIMFTSMFFISIGTMVDFFSLRQVLPLLTVIILLIVITRFIAVGFVSSLLVNLRKDQIIFSSIAMIAVSEFSLLIAAKAMKFNLGIDFVSLTAFSIFISAIIMSLSISHFTRVSTLLDTSLPGKWKHKPKSLSNYINLLFNELDHENIHTKKFRKLFFNFNVLFFVLFLMIIGLGEYASAIQALSKHGIDILIVILFIGISSYLLHLIFENIKGAYHTLAVILSDCDSSNFRRSEYILNKLLITLTLFIFAIFSPLLFVRLDFSIWLNFIPFGLLAIIFFNLIKIVNVIDTHRLREY